MAEIKELRDALGNSRMQAFLRALRYGEGTRGINGYRTLFGGELFENFDDHPRRVITRNIKQNGVSKPISSTAAGAYQFLMKTWNGLVSQYGKEAFPDFTPSSQDLGAVALIAGRRALEDVLEGRIERAVEKCNKEWASLPGSPYGQPTTSLGAFLGHYATELKLLGTVEEPITEPEITAPPKKEKWYMAPALIPVILAALKEAIPAIAKLFQKSEVAERNVKLAEQVVEISTQVAGAVNAQDMLEKVQTDPQIAQKVEEGVRDKWYDLIEVGGGVGTARKFDLEAMAGPGRFWMSPSFWIGILLLPLVYMIVASLVGLIGTAVWSDDVRSALAGTIVGTVVGGLVGYYFGQVTSRNRST